MRNFDSNITTLFNSLNKGNTFNFADYAFMKSGSYGKLMKSYYADQKNLVADKDEITNQIENTKKVTASGKDTIMDKNLSEMKKDSDGLKKSVSSLGQDELMEKKNGEYDIEKISAALGNFVNDYNKVIEQSGKTNSKNVEQSTKYMTSLTGAMSKALSKIGITVGFDGKLALNEENIKNVKVDDIKELFSGKSSYGYAVGEKASEISKAAVTDSGLYGSNGSFNGAFAGMFSSYV